MVQVRQRPGLVVVAGLGVVVGLSLPSAALGLAAWAKHNALVAVQLPGAILGLYLLFVGPPLGVAIGRTAVVAIERAEATPVGALRRSLRRSPALLKSASDVAAPLARAAFVPRLRRSRLPWRVWLRRGDRAFDRSLVHSLSESMIVLDTCSADEAAGGAFDLLASRPGVAGDRATGALRWGLVHVAIVAVAFGWWSLVTEQHWRPQWPYALAALGVLIHATAVSVAGHGALLAAVRAVHVEAAEPIAPFDVEDVRAALGIDGSIDIS